MSIDLNKLKTIAKTHKTVASGYLNHIKSNVNKYKIREGDNHIRILPPVDKDDFWGFDVKVHYNVGDNKGSIICNRYLHKQQCPLCDEYDKARKKNDEALSLLYKPAKRCLVWVLDLKDPSKGVLILDAPSSLIDEILLHSESKKTHEIIDVSHPTLGREIWFERSGTGKLTEYKNIQIDTEPAPIESHILAKIKPFTEVIINRTYEELKQEIYGTSSVKSDIDKGLDPELEDDDLEIDNIKNKFSKL